MNRLYFALCGCAMTLVACAHRDHPVDYLPGAEVLLMGSQHLGNDVAEGQAFASGGATAARVCSLVNVSSATSAFIQVRDVRSTETLADQLTVNGVGYPLPITLERVAGWHTSNAMKASPVIKVKLEAGPSEVCLVAGIQANGDLDDFEVEQVVLFVQDIDASDVTVRRDLMLGSPAYARRPSETWGRRQVGTSGH